jgi:hypothetical protein
MHETVTLDRRFCGPPDSGNGGYTCGVLASFVTDGDTEVTLRLPPPLAQPLTVRDVGDGDGARVELVAPDGTVVADAAPTTVAIGVPLPVRVDDAARAAAASPFLVDASPHPFPTCFVCGPHRAPGDGLRLLATKVPGREVVAAAWEPHASLPAHDGLLAREIVWAALDCPSGLTMYLDPPLEPPYVLGRLAAHVVAPVRVGAPYAVVGWREGTDGRKLFAGSAIFDDAGNTVAYARATWVQLKSAQ